MPESAVAELAPAPTAAETLDADSIASFDKASKENAGPEPQAEPAPETAPKAKVDPAKPAAQPAKGEIPEELLTGVKPEAPPEKDDDDPFKAELPASASEKHKVNWRRAREANEANLARIASMAKEIETHKATPRVDEAMAEKYKALETERTELLAKLERADFQQSPRFQKFLAQEKSLLDAAKANLKGTEVDAETIELAARATGQVRRKILEDSGIDASLLPLITPYLARLDELNGEKSAALENHKTFLAEDSQRAKAREEQAIKAQIDEAGKVFDTVLKSLIPKLAPLQKLDPEKYPQWNLDADEIPKLAKRMFTNDMDLADAAELAIMGASGLKLHKMVGDLQGRLRAANETIKAMTASQPTAGSESNGRFHPSNDATGDSADAQSTRAFERAAAANRNQ